MALTHIEEKHMPGVAVEASLQAWREQHESPNPSPVSENTLAVVAGQLSSLSHDMYDLKHEVAQMRDDVSYRFMAQEQMKRSAETLELSDLAKDIQELKQWRQEVKSFAGLEQISALIKDVAELREWKQEDQPRQKPSAATEITMPPSKVSLEEKHQSEQSGADFDIDSFDARLDHYTINESTWDSFAFVGFGMPLHVMFFILCSIVVTVAFSMTFIALTYANYRDHEFTDNFLDGVLHWRATVAHNIDNADRSVGTSLAARVCAQSSATARSAYQMQTYEDISVFRRSPLDGLRDLNGYILCNMALALWFFSILRDLILNYRYTSSVLAQPQGVPSIKEIGDQIRLARFSRVHVISLVLVVTIPRLCIALTLGYVGTYFLAYTSDVGELLLNAIALTFVLEIDEMFFHALLPMPVKMMMRRVEPLRTAEARRSVISGVMPAAGLGLSQFHMLSGSMGIFTFRITSVLLGLVCCNILILKPFNEKLDLAIKYLCSGRKDIVYTVNKANEMVVVSQVPKYAADALYRMSYWKLAVLDAIQLLPEGYSSSSSSPLGRNGTDIVSVGRGPRQTSRSSASPLEGLAALASSDRAYAAQGFQCIDHLDLQQLQDLYVSEQEMAHYAYASKAVLEDLFKLADVTNCSQLSFEDYCLRPEPAAMRAICSRQCGCDDPWSGQFYATGENGCPQSCDYRWSLRVVYFVPESIAEHTRRCMDVPKAVLSIEPSWKRYVLGASRYFALHLGNEEASQVAKRLLRNGCEFVAAIRYRWDLCESKSAYRSVRMWCPLTCQCSMSDLKECPIHCSYREIFQRMSQFIPSCPAGTLQIQSQEECARAGTFLRNRPQNATVVEHAADIPPGCSMMKGGPVFWSIGNATTINSNVYMLCRQGQPLMLDALAVGNFDLGRHMGQCMLDDGLVRRDPKLPRGYECVRSER